MRDRAQNMYAIFPLKFDLYVYFGEKQILDDPKLEVKFQKFRGSNPNERSLFGKFFFQDF
jgi:hypothetical protein